MNGRQMVLRNREVNLQIENEVKNKFTGVTTRKRAALKALENNGMQPNAKVVLQTSKTGRKISSKVVKEEFKIEPMDISCDNKENQQLSYEQMIENPFEWPKCSELVTPEQRDAIVKVFKSRRNAIRVNFKDLNENGNPIWFPSESVNRDEYMHGEYLANINDYLMEIELNFNPLGRDFLENSITIGPRQRYIFVNYIVHVHSQFSMCAETLHLTIAICDRFIKANKATLKVEDLSIIGMMGLFIAAKVEEVIPPSLENLEAAFNLDYSYDLCKKLELQMVSTIECRLSIPLPISFIRHYNIIIEANTLSHYLSRYFCELSIQDYVASGHSINLLASSCVFLAQVICQKTKSNFERVWNAKLQTSSGLLFTDIKPLVRNLCIIVSKQSATSNYRAISMKYSSTRLMNVYDKSLTSEGFKNILQYFKSELKSSGSKSLQ